MSINANTTKFAMADNQVTSVKCEVVDFNTVRAKYGLPALSKGNKYFGIEELRLVPEAQAKGDVNIYVTIKDEMGAPIASELMFMYPSERRNAARWDSGIWDNGKTQQGDVFFYASGSGAIAQGPNDFEPGAESVGPYMLGVWSHPVEGQGVSSQFIAGFGLPFKHHVSYIVVFKIMTYGGDSSDTTDNSSDTTTDNSSDSGDSDVTITITDALTKTEFIKFIEAGLAAIKD